MGKYSNLSFVVLSVLVVPRAVLNPPTTNTDAKQMGKFLTDKAARLCWCVGWWWWCSNLYTYGKSLSFSRRVGGKWIFQMCYFICAIWHFFHPLWLFSLWMWVAPRDDDCDSSFLFEIEWESLSWKGDYWHRKTSCEWILNSSDLVWLME